MCYKLYFSKKKKKKKKKKRNIISTNILITIKYPHDKSHFQPFNFKLIPETKYVFQP